jgi:hypothetical protein
MEICYIIKADSSNISVNNKPVYMCYVIIALSEVRLRDHGVCLCNQVLSVLLSQAREDVET